MLFIIFPFFLVALIYSTVGFGGGTSYIAILAISSIQYTLIPKISLLCNILVTAGGTWQYNRRGHLRKKLFLPFVLSSVPMSFFGGSFKISENLFYFLLITALMVSGLRIFFIPDNEKSESKTPSFIQSLLIGGFIGLLAGMTGIGGGIFLSPLLINMRWARSKEAAAFACLFILLNSMAGLSGQFYKESSLPDLMTYIPIFAAVIVGGQLGSRVGTHPLVSFNTIQKATAILTLFISLRLLIKFIH